MYDANCANRELPYGTTILRVLNLEDARSNKTAVSAKPCGLYAKQKDSKEYGKHSNPTFLSAVCVPVSRVPRVVAKIEKVVGVGFICKPNKELVNEVIEKIGSQVTDSEFRSV